MHLPPVSAGVENQDVLQDKIEVEQPIKKTRRRRGEAAAERQAAQAAAGNVSKPARSRPHSGVVIKTKFPVARIKRIMQADEDVGKVAQVTPVIVCKLHTIRHLFFFSLQDLVEHGTLFNAYSTFLYGILEASHCGLCRMITKPLCNRSRSTNIVTPRFQLKHWSSS